MEHRFVNAWNYNITYEENSFFVSLDGRRLGHIQKPSSGRWPIFAVINDRLYSFSKRGTFHTVMEVANAITGEVAATIKMPYLFSVFSRATFEFANGERLLWKADNFFSLYWKWEKGDRVIMKAANGPEKERNSGVITIGEYNKEHDFLIVAGFLFSLLRKSKRSMGLAGLKRKAALSFG